MNCAGNQEKFHTAEKSGAGTRRKPPKAQINGGITDTCICLIPCRNAPVPYATANTASKLYADIEVINVLSKFYDTELPLFFDNRERVNFVPRTEGQIITLSVSDDEEMRVEIN